MFNAYLRLLKVACWGSLALPVLVWCCSQWITGTPLSLGDWWLWIVIILLMAVSFLRPIPYREGLERISLQQARFLDTIPTRQVNALIILAAAVGLFLELVVIRWHSAVFPVFAFYKNFSLLSCFAGLGLGYALAKKESVPLIFVPPLLAGQIFLLNFLLYGLGGWRHVSLFSAPMSEQFHMGIDVATSVPHHIAVYGLILVAFILTVLTFLPIGQLCGRLMERKDNLEAYGMNLLGSLAGVALLYAASLLWTSPVIWFAAAFLMLMVFLRWDSQALFIGACFALVSLMILGWPKDSGIEQIYSPYQLLERGPGQKGLMNIRAAGLYHQKALNLEDSGRAGCLDEASQHIADYYEMPYKIFGRPPRRVVIVGSGTGNDAAAALRCGSPRIDAIEIDPAILRLGQMYHPERPYSDPRVDVIVNDARNFFRSSDRIYDMVVYGLLDSHTLLSHASGVRLDSFVYTVEGIREARLRLAEGGLMSLSFYVVAPQLGRKIYLMMTEAFDGVPPTCLQTDYDASILFLNYKHGGLKVDPGLIKDKGFRDVTPYFQNPALRADPSTDDWPFFYMPRRVFPLSYVLILLFLLLLTALLVFYLFRYVPSGGHWVFFFLGSGFMLVETRGITEMGLLFGNTWQVIAIVIFSILCMAFLSNVAVLRFRVARPLLPFLLLLGSLAAGYLILRGGLIPVTAAGKLTSMLLFASPVFFSGIVFSTLLRANRYIAGVMAINILGAMLGGTLEYNSMYKGFGFLYILAFACYFLALVIYLGTCRRNTSPMAGNDGDPRPPA